MFLIRFMLLFLTIFIYCNSSCQAEITDPSVFVLSDEVLPGFPHEFDIYGTVTADRAVVFLHGGGGRKSYSAYQLGIKEGISESDYTHIDEEWLSQNNILLIFPQGQSIEAAPLSTTWSNHVMDSGADDMAFLRELASHIRTNYGVDYVAIAGHSNGGMMTNRVWCEDPSIFDAYISFAGPMAYYYVSHPEECPLQVIKPYMGMIGGNDTIIQTQDNWNDIMWEVNPNYQTAAFVNPFLINEFDAYGARRSLRCGSIGGTDELRVLEGNNNAWLGCNNAMVLIKVETSDHSVESLEAASNSTLRDLMMVFIGLNP